MRPASWIVPGFVLALLSPALAQAQTLPKTEYSCNFGNPDAGDRSGQSTVYRCRPTAGSSAPVFNVAVLKGASAEVYRAHGYLLGREAKSGPLNEAVSLVQFGLAQQSVWLRPSLRNVVNCFSTKLFDSLDYEFKANMAAFDEGYRQRLGTAAKYPTAQLHMAAVGIELDNIMTAVGYKHKALGQAALAEEHCPGGLLVKAIVEGGLKLVGRDKGLGCTSFAVPGKGPDGTILSEEGLLFARTLDAELVRSWNRVPTLFVMHEEGLDPDRRPYLSYVGTGSAGMIYPGGISGFNTEGITASLHQMWSADATLSVPAAETPKAALAPVIVQTILREARSIDDAIKIAKRYQIVATWAIFVADAKTGEIASIEISKGGVKAARRAQGRPMGQTNHIFDAGQKAFAFFPNYNKYNETRTRLATLEKAFVRLQDAAAQGHPYTAAQAATQLANHDDTNGRFEPFATTSVKAYDVMSTVMLPQAHKIYMSTGDFLPAPHSTFLGFQLDGDLNPVAAAGTLRDQTLAGTPGVFQSLNDFVQARLAYEFKDYAGAEHLTRQAITHSRSEELNGSSPDWADRKAGSLRTYNYILARVLALKATESPYSDGQTLGARQAAYEESRELFRTVIADPAVLPYQRALAEYHLGLTEMKFQSKRSWGAKLSPGTAALMKDALGVFQSGYQRVKPDSDIREMASNIANAQKVMDGKPVKAEDVDWVVIR